MQDKVYNHASKYNFDYVKGLMKVWMLNVRGSKKIWSIEDQRTKQMQRKPEIIREDEH